MRWLEAEKESVEAEKSKLLDILEEVKAQNASLAHQMRQQQ